MAILDHNIVDSNGKKLIWDDNIKEVVFYSSEYEAWDKTGSGTASWYRENELPYDAFAGVDLNIDKWSFFNYRGVVSGTLNDGLMLSISGSSARGGVTSENKWKLKNDFDVRLYIDEHAYYNEYRGSSATGLTVSYGDANKIRVSKYFSRPLKEIGYAVHYVNSYPLNFVGWQEDYFSSSVGGESDITCLRIARNEGEISTYVSNSLGFVKVGSDFSGDYWAEDLGVEIEVEAEMFNYYSAGIVGFSVSGTLSDSSTVFNSSFRGVNKSFPDKALLVVDGKGLSIVDEASMSLWMRFNQFSDGMFKTTDCKVAASNGRVYYTTASGLVCLDFQEDKAFWYVDSVKKSTRVGLADRNFKNSFYTQGDLEFLPNDTCLSVEARVIDEHEFLAVGTSAGLGILIDRSLAKVEDSVDGDVSLVNITDSNYVFWNNYSTLTSNGFLFYKSNILALIDEPGLNFIYTGYYSKDTVPLSISSVDITSLDVKNNNSKLVISHNYGIDYINGAYKITYGPLEKFNPIVDGTFSQDIGISWNLITQCLFSVFEVTRTDEWISAGDKSIKLKLNSSGIVYTGNYGGIYQYIDLTDVDYIYFDYRLVNAAPTTSNYLDLVIKVNDTVVYTVKDNTTTNTKLSIPINVAGFTGVCLFMVSIYSMYTGSSVDYNYFYVDNFRIVPGKVDYSIISSSSYLVKSAVLWNDPSGEKIFFNTETGYGSIDVSSNTLDYFLEVDDVLPLSTITASVYIEEEISEL